MQLLKTIVLTSIFIWGLGKAFHYGAIWDGQAHPTKNVKISSTAAGLTMVGDLVPLWNGKYRLVNGDQSIEFARDNFTIETKMDTSNRRSTFSRWRSLLPAAMLFALYVMGSLAAIINLSGRDEDIDTRPTEST